MQAISSADAVQLHDALPFPERDGGRALAMLVGRRRAMWKAIDDLCLESDRVDEAAECMVACLRGGGRILVAGNGGSAAEAQHFATELVGRFLRERAPYPVMSLTADSAVITAIANDYGFEQVFARQVAAHGQPGDVFVAFSTSGESKNLLCAVEAARRRDVTVIAVTGGALNRMAAMADIAIRVPASATPVIQELHTIVLHVLCDLVETAMAAPHLRAQAQ